MKRFWKQADLLAEPTGFTLTLDGKPARTPAGKPLTVPNTKLGAALVAEWNGQGDAVLPHTMPQTQFVCTVLDKMADQRDTLIPSLLAYADTDLLCHRAATPPDLATRQAAAWDPWLAWAQMRYDVGFVVTTDILAAPQSPRLSAALGLVLAALDDWHLAALQAAVYATGSLILGLALLDGEITAEQAFDLAELEHSYQIEKWGDDPESTKRRAGLRVELAATHFYLQQLSV
jgi:chaperone required for assembly of F1-ATPase